MKGEREGTYSPATLLVCIRGHLEATPVVSFEDTAFWLEAFVLDEHRALLLLDALLALLGLLGFLGLLGLVLADVGGG
jgi:hypothetical protein